MVDICGKVIDMTTTNSTARPSDKQLNLLAKLAVERGTTVQELADRKFNEGFDLNTLTGGRDGSASALITFTFGIPRVGGNTVGNTKFDPEAGMYADGDDIFRVKISKSGNWYAQRAIKPMPGSGRKSLDWEYLGKRVNLANARQLSEAEAGKYLGYCIRCNAELTDPESIERGMGPICATRVE